MWRLLARDDKDIIIWHLQQLKAEVLVQPTVVVAQAGDEGLLEVLLGKRSDTSGLLNSTAKMRKEHGGKTLYSRLQKSIVQTALIYNIVSVSLQCRLLMLHISFLFFWNVLACFLLFHTPPKSNESVMQSQCGLDLECALL